MDISLKVRAEALGKSLENLAPMVENEINTAIKDLAYAVYAAMVGKIQKMEISQDNRKTYLSGLKIDNLGNDAYLIHLDGTWANKLEKGFGSYSIRDVLLKSTKIVGVGSRAGKPWVRKAEDGHKYAAVPFEHRPHANPTGDLGKDIKTLMARGVNGQVQKLNKIFRDEFGNPIQGKAAVVHKSDTTNPRLAGLVKYQHVHSSGKVSSLYMTYRMVSENGKDWKHPGFDGYQIFKAAQDYVESEMDNIIKTLLK